MDRLTPPAEPRDTRYRAIARRIQANIEAGPIPTGCCRACGT